MELFDVLEATTNLSNLLDKAAQGETIVICKAGTPVAQLTAYTAEATPRSLGGWEGQVWISDDFDEPNAEIDELFYGNQIEVGTAAAEDGGKMLPPQA